jgi:hypothetical protein
MPNAVRSWRGFYPVLLKETVFPRMQQKSPRISARLGESCPVGKKSDSIGIEIIKSPHLKAQM